MELNTGTKEILWFVLEEWKLILFLTIIFSLYMYYTNTFEFFEKKGVKFMKPLPVVGNFGARLLAKKSFHQFQYDVYQFFKGSPYGGEYFFFLIKNYQVNLDEIPVVDYLFGIYFTC